MTSRRTIANHALVILTFTSVTLALTGLGAAGLNYWYLFFSPLVLAAFFYGLRGALLAGTATFGSLVILHWNSVVSYRTPASSAQSLQGFMAGFPSLPLLDLNGKYAEALLGAGLMVLGAVVIGALNDSERRQEERVMAILRQDPLTGLLTRQHFVQVLRRWSQEKFNEKAPLALVLFDVDHFGALQERYGHYSGDLVLERIGKVLLPFQGPSTAVGRLGSDEFGLACRGLDPKEVQETAAKICLALREYDWTGARNEGLAEQLSASFGIAFLPQDGTTPGELLKKAGEALEQQKARGGNGIHFASLVSELDPAPPRSPATTLEEWREALGSLVSPLES